MMFLIEGTRVLAVTFANDLEDRLFGIMQAKNSVAADQMRYTR